MRRRNYNKRFAKITIEIDSRAKSESRYEMLLGTLFRMLLSIKLLTNKSTTFHFKIDEMPMVKKAKEEVKKK